MDFISEVDSAETGVELKYCERCGGLFLRLCGTSLAYCGTCKNHIVISRPLPVTGRTRRKAILPGYRSSANRHALHVTDLCGVAVSEVRPC